MSKKARKRAAAGETDAGRFIEIVNWKKAQPRMKAGQNNWMKLYTSLLDNDAFASLDDTSRMLIVALWLYAARSGRHVFPADPQWLVRKIPMLNSPPDLTPLLEAADAFGNPTPFVRYCKPPRAKKPRAGKAAKKQGDKKRVEKNRESRAEETKPSRVSGEQRQRRKDGLPSKRAAEPEDAAAAAEQAPEPEKPANPMKSEDGGPNRHIVPRPPTSAQGRSRPQQIGDIVSGRFPEHWQDEDAEAFGWEIVRALGMSDDPHNLKTRSEWGAFAAWWIRVKKAAPVLALGELREMAVRKAEYVRTKAKSARNPSAVWLSIMGKEMDHRGLNVPPPARASPVSRTGR